MSGDRVPMKYGYTVRGGLPVAVRRVWLRVAACVMLFLVATLFCLTSCAPSKPPAAAGDVAQAMLDAVRNAPAGSLRTRTADPDGAEYLSSALLSALFGPACRDWLEPEEGEVPLIGDAAVFLPTALHPGELAVFRCTRQDGTVSAAAVCESRLVALRSAWADSEYAGLLGRATVRVEDCYVFLIVADDPDAVLEAARRVIQK